MNVATPAAQPAPARAAGSPPRTAKIVIGGGFGAGKTTFVGAVSEIAPLTTEAVLTEAGVGVDDTSHVGVKTSTTVAMDFGRLTLADDLILYLFGTPGQERYWFMWEELAKGAIGAVVVADTRRLADSFPVIDFLEGRDLPFLVAVNQFDGAHPYPAAEVRRALGLASRHPIVSCDARQRDSSRDVLIALLDHAMARALS